MTYSSWHDIRPRRSAPPAAVSRILGPRPLAGTLIAAAAAALMLAAAADPAFAHDSLDHEIAEATARIEAGPPAAADYLTRGELYRLDHEWERALADYDHAARLNPSLKAVELCRGALYLDRGEPEHARELLDRFLADDSTNTDALGLRAEVWLALATPAEAVRDYDRMIAHLKSPTPDHYLARAQAVAACGPEHLDEALRGLDRAIERLGPLVSLEFHAIDLELARGDYDAALARLDRVAPQFARPEAVLERRGEILAAAGREREARQAREEALASIEKTPPARRTAALVEMQTRLKNALAGDAPASSSARPGTEEQP